MKSSSPIVALTTASCTMIAGLDEDYRLGDPSVVATSASTTGVGGSGASGSGGSAPLGPFGPPEPLTDLNSSANEDDPTATGDLLEIYFDSTRAGTMGISDIWYSKRMAVGDDWPAPQVAMELSSGAADTSPEISPDGLTMFLSSNRAGGDFDIYMSRRMNRNETWPTPEPVDSLNSVSNDYGVGFMPDLLHLVLASTRDGTFDLFATRRMGLDQPWETPGAITELNSGALESDPWIDASGTVLYFTGDRLANVDIHIAERASRGEMFAMPEVVAEISGADLDQDPWLSPDMKTVLFASDRAGTLDLYMAKR